MINRKLFIAGSLAALTLLDTASAWADIKLGVFPRRSVAVTYKAFQPLAEKLSEVLGEKVELVTAKNFPAFWKGVENKEFDLVHYNQYHYIKSHKEQGYKVIVAQEERGKRNIAGALSVRKDSGIESIADLKGKTILFGGGRKAMGSYIAPTALLKQHGLIEGTDYQAKFSRNPPTAAVAVYNKAADAAGTGDVILDLAAVTQRIDVSKMQVLATSESYTQMPWAVADRMPEAKANKIQAFLVALEQGDPLLKAARVTGYFVATDADYDKAREITQYATGEDLY